MQCNKPGKAVDRPGIRHPRQYITGTFHRTEKGCTVKTLDAAATNRQAHKLDIIDEFGRTKEAGRHG
eukprot:10870073-Heterocapsa_arctica.AAC.1